MYMRCAASMLTLKPVRQEREAGKLFCASLRQSQSCQKQLAQGKRTGTWKIYFFFITVSFNPLSIPSSFLSPPPAQPSGLLAAQGQRRYGTAHLLYVPHRPLPLHVLGVRPALRHPAVQRALPLAAVRQRGQLVHPGAAGLLVRSALPKGLPSVPP